MFDARGGRDAANSAQPGPGTKGKRNTRGGGPPRRPPTPQKQGKRAHGPQVTRTEIEIGFYQGGTIAGG